MLDFGRHGSVIRWPSKLAWGSVAGSALQFAVQLPLVMRLVPRTAAALAFGAANVRAVIRNFGAGVRQPRGGADQRLRGSAAREPAGPRARWRR